MRVVIVGQGYVGLPLAVRAAQVGHDVVGFDVDEERIKRLAGGESYVDDIKDAELREILDAGMFHPATDPRACAGFDVAVISVPTPLREGMPDLSYIEQAARTLARYLRPGATVALESTTYPGTTNDLVAPILEEGSGLTAGTDFYLGYSPERIDPGNTEWTLVSTPKVVSGINPTSLEKIRTFYGTIVDTTVPVSETRVAELAKLLENTYRHVNIALVNELAVFAHELGIDVWEAIDAAASKPFGYQRFVPGPGVGGHCLPIDPSYLSWRVQRALGQSFRFVELANDINNHMPDYVVRRLVAALNRQRKAVNGSTVLLLGLAYKRNSGDARESPARRIAALLLEMGADVRAADPHVVEDAHIDRRVTRVQPTAEQLAAADAVLLLADHDAFDLDLVVQHAGYVLDTRHRLTGPTVESL
ncbi:nucleotide sugar dehydrogenase [Actinoplanes sp. NPDC051513]|uniref:nucleotide sugar dehydrogenase n=1 Tax=Actinoplanes sp. NPDC051513 TaxID=3363908 RepID=UPI00378F05CE